MSNLNTNCGKLVKFVIKFDPRIALHETGETIDTEWSNPFGLDLIHHDGKQLLIVTSWKENMIEPIDYKTGEIVRKIHGEFGGKKIEPHGICHDNFGNLYIADGTSNRILVVSPDGKIKQNLIGTPHALFLVGWLELQRLVVNYSTNKEMFKIDKINYVNP